MTCYGYGIIVCNMVKIQKKLRQAARTYIREACDQRKALESAGYSLEQRGNVHVRLSSESWRVAVYQEAQEYMAEISKQVAKKEATPAQHKAAEYLVKVQLERVGLVWGEAPLPDKPKRKRSDSGQVDW